MANKITEKFLDELEGKIREYKGALRRKTHLDTIGDKMPVRVPFFNKQIEYTVTQEEKDAIEQEAINKEQELRDKIKEIEKEAQI